MRAFIHRAGCGFWATDSERDALLDWFVENRCGPGVPGGVPCLDAGHRLPRQSLDLAELLPEGETFGLSPTDVDRARHGHPNLIAVLSMVVLVASGGWSHRADSEEAVWWRVPWLAAPSFTVPGVWSDDCCDLHLDFERPEPARGTRATTALWSHAHVQGCWLAEDREPTAETRVGPPFFSEADRAAWGPPAFEGPGSLHGFARVHGLHAVPCATHLGLGEDYMYLTLTLRAAALRRWMPAEIEPEGSCGPRMFAWLAGIGRHVHERVPIRAAVIGWEPSPPGRSLLGRRRLEPTCGYLLPRGSEFEYVAPTRFSRP